jgi:hypothetical protein
MRCIIIDTERLNKMKETEVAIEEAAPEDGIPLV